MGTSIVTNFRWALWMVILACAVPIPKDALADGWRGYWRGGAYAVRFRAAPTFVYRPRRWGPPISYAAPPRIAAYVAPPLYAAPPLYTVPPPPPPPPPPPSPPAAFYSPPASSAWNEPPPTPLIPMPSANAVPLPRVSVTALPPPVSAPLSGERLGGVSALPADFSAATLP